MAKRKNQFQNSKFKSQAATEWIIVFAIGIVIAIIVFSFNQTAAPPIAESVKETVSEIKLAYGDNVGITNYIIRSNYTEFYVRNNQIETLIITSFNVTKNTSLSCTENNTFAPYNLPMKMEPGQVYQIRCNLTEKDYGTDTPIMLPVSITTQNPETGVTSTTYLAAGAASFATLTFSDCDTTNASLCTNISSGGGSGGDSGSNSSNSSNGIAPTWNKTYSTFSYGTGNRILVDASNNIHISGNISVSNSSFYLKLNSAGTAQWNLTSENNTYYYVCGIDSQNNIYISKVINYSNYSLSQYNSSGNLSWEKSGNETHYLCERTDSLVFDSFDNFYIFTSNITSTNYYLLNYNSSGTLLSSSPVLGNTTTIANERNSFVKDQSGNIFFADAIEIYNISASFTAKIGTTTLNYGNIFVSNDTLYSFEHTGSSYLLRSYYFNWSPINVTDYSSSNSIRTTRILNGNSSNIFFVIPNSTSGGITLRNMFYVDNSTNTTNSTVLNTSIINYDSYSYSDVAYFVTTTGKVYMTGSTSGIPIVAKYG